MHNSVDLAVVQDVLQLLVIEEFAGNELSAWRDAFAMPLTEIVIDDGAVGVRQQLLHHHASDVAGPACYKNAHELKNPFPIGSIARIVKIRLNANA